jgi:hypothetical protein
LDDWEEALAIAINIDDWLVVTPAQASAYGPTFEVHPGGAHPRVKKQTAITRGIEFNLQWRTEPYVGRQITKAASWWQTKITKMKKPRAGDALLNRNVCELDNHMRVRAGHCAEDVNIVAIAEKLRSRGYRVHRTILKKYLRTVNADAARGAAVDPEGNRAAADGILALKHVDVQRTHRANTN